MEKINSADDLHNAIQQLEQVQTVEAKLMKEQFLLAYESVKPINLIKSTLNEVRASKDLKETVVQTTIGLTTGYVTKKIFEGESPGPIKKLFGAAIEVGITNAVAKNPEAIKSVGIGILKIIRNRIKRQG